MKFFKIKWTFNNGRTEIIEGNDIVDALIKNDCGAILNCLESWEEIEEVENENI